MDLDASWRIGLSVRDRVRLDAPFTEYPWNSGPGAQSEPPLEPPFLVREQPLGRARGDSQGFTTRRLRRAPRSRSRSGRSGVGHRIIGLTAAKGPSRILYAFFRDTAAGAGWGCEPLAPSLTPRRRDSGRGCVPPRHPATGHTSYSPTRAYCPEAPGDCSSWGPPRKGRPGPLAGPRHITSLNIHTPGLGPGSAGAPIILVSPFNGPRPLPSHVLGSRLRARAPGRGSGIARPPPRVGPAAWDSRAV